MNILTEGKTFFESIKTLIFNFVLQICNFLNNYFSDYEKKFFMLLLGGLFLIYDLWIWLFWCVLLFRYTITYKILFGSIGLAIILYLLYPIIILIKFLIFWILYIPAYIIKYEFFSKDKTNYLFEDNFKPEKL